MTNQCPAPLTNPSPCPADIKEWDKNASIRYCVAIRRLSGEDANVAIYAYGSRGVDSAPFTGGIRHNLQRVMVNPAGASAQPTMTREANMTPAQ